MATTVNLRPFRDYDEHDVINLFAHRSSAVNKGSLVKLETATGWKNTNEPTMEEGIIGASYGNTVSNRYAVRAKVMDAASGSNVIGMTLWDVKETDENGEKLLYNPRKAAEMQCVISGQAVPVATRGVFLYSGATLNATHATQGPVAGEYLYAADDGQMMVASSVGWDSTVAKVGQVLGGMDSSNHVLIRLDI
jgi:hypothetical protein